MSFHLKTAFKHLASSTIILGALSSAPSFAQTAGDFGYYAFAQTWLPEFCVQNPQKDSCKNLPTASTTAIKLTIHGLWPNYDEGGYPSYCSNSPGCSAGQKAKDCKIDINSSTESQLNTYMPGGSGGFWQYEWEKHGTCSALDQDTYFQEALKLEKTLPTLATIESPTTLKTLEQKYNSRAIFKCNNDDGVFYLSEVRTYWNKNTNNTVDSQKEAIPTGEKSTCPSEGDIFLRSFPSNWLY
ncbi:T2 family ribonuclease [Piscirickettsia litoralis]|uniref:Uncharacterized protein n=1 Tax=Piscirickettsia litoralis TaxID=1891921 RepID=A0ABX3A6T4_9GAMM|nr:T2 family ribonuclease [Piscirickettsia litoralis]ODN41819.1 hypothetical protein BGC07_01035 [Piscirickettsia litoralis]